MGSTCLATPAKILLVSNEIDVVFEWSYKVNTGRCRPSTATSWHTVDVFFKLLLKANKRVGLWSTSPVVQLFEVDVDASKLFEGQRRAIKLVIPQSSGYVAHSDFTSIRCQRCEHVEIARSFTTPHQYFPGVMALDTPYHNVSQLLNLAAAAFLIDSDEYGPKLSLEQRLQYLNRDLVNRLSLPWLVGNKPAFKTVALIDGGFKPAPRSDVYMAAKALGIRLIVLDRPGHWLQTPAYQDWVETFIPTDITPTDDLEHRIIDAIRAYGRPVDALVTFFDQAMVATANAAVRLGLKTNVPSAYAIGADKFKTSQFIGHPSVRASSAEEALGAVRNSGLQYPLVIKPCAGWSAEGVYKVDTENDILPIFNAIDTSRHGADVSIEVYCDGPEVDVNFVMCNDELLFFEASDEFPKAADHAGSVVTSGFQCTEALFPSALPQSELTCLRTSLSRILNRIGASNGVFHLEARVRNSAIEYGQKDGLWEMRAVPDLQKNRPLAHLIEINMRPPGAIVNGMVTMLYGIDYHASNFCLILGDEERARALATPFAAGPCCWGELIMLPVTAGGTFGSNDIFKELFGRRPELAQHIERPMCFFEKGDKVPEPGRHNTWVAGCLVFSTENRDHCHRVAQDVRGELKWTII